MENVGVPESCDGTKNSDVSGDERDDQNVHLMSGHRRLEVLQRSVMSRRRNKRRVLPLSRHAP